jgi:hypothetical protein
MTEDKVPIKFLQKCSPYNAGEVAGFPPAMAKRYVDAGIADYHNPEKVFSISVEEVIPDTSGGDKQPSQEEHTAVGKNANTVEELQLLQPLAEHMGAGEKDNETQSVEVGSGQESTAAAGSKKSGKR